MTDDTYTLVLDRFEGEDAVLLVERGGDLIDELVFPSEMLPSNGRRQDAVFTATTRDDAVELTYEPETTQERRQEAQDRFDQLSRRLPDENSSEER